MSEDWLKTLKVGDTVIVDTSAGCYLTTVSKITPTGRIKVSWGKGETVFDSRGYEIGGSTWHTATLAKPTQERRDGIAQRSLAYKLEKTAWRALPLETLRAVAALLDA